MAAKGMRERHGMHCSKIRNVVPRRVGASLKGIVTVNLPGFTFFCLTRLFSTLFFSFFFCWNSSKHPTDFMNHLTVSLYLNDIIQLNVARWNKT